jgi:L-seryl-tRNA(Ser) seleniumtransferase
VGGSEGDLQDRLRSLPGVDRVMEAIESSVPRARAGAAARRAIDEARAAIRAGAEGGGFDSVVERARSILGEEGRAELGRVINATGVMIHTNLGRVPLGRAQLDAVAEIAGGYSNLEYDVEAGRRGDRYSHASRLLCNVTGAEAALVVNNNAAAVLLVLAALCGGRDVVISRGELIEIGGEFRIPDVLSESGARLIEVGTTNRTHLADYERAIGPHTAAILKVHPSNYRVVGFTATVEGRELARLARGRGVLFLHDLGSGLLDLPPETSAEASWLAAEPPVSLALADGADIVTFSGDKLLGGPQCGVILGRAELLARLSGHPLLRALRVDKMTLAALEATVRAYLYGRGYELPMWRMALATGEELEGRARSLAAALTDTLAESGVKAEAVPSRALAGGGSLPGTDVPSWAVAVSHPEKSAAEIERALRRAEPPVIGRIEDDLLLLDLRTVDPANDQRVAELVTGAL